MPRGRWLPVQGFAHGAAEVVRASPPWLRGIEPSSPPTRWISPFTPAGSPAGSRHLTEPAYEVL